MSSIDKGAELRVIECSGMMSASSILTSLVITVDWSGRSPTVQVPVEIGKKSEDTRFPYGTKDWFPRTIRFMSTIKDQYDFEALNTHHFKFEDLDKAMDMAANHKDIARKVMLTFDE